MAHRLQPIVILSDLLKETGFLAIIYLATISAIDPTLYEAAIIDGANRWQLMRHVTLPGLAITIVTLFILQIGFFLYVGFEQIFVLQNAMVLTTGDIIETFIYRVGIQRARFDFTTAAGLFNGLVGMVMVLIADRIARKMDLPGIF
jgi:putative aldouronate transport system permease protein